MAPVLGRPLAAYPIMTALSAPSVDRVYVVTEAEELRLLAESLGARPIAPAKNDASPRSAIDHGARAIEQNLKLEGQTLELLVIMFAHCATVTPHAIEEGIAVLRKNGEIDAAVTVSRLWQGEAETSCRIGRRGLLEPAPGSSLGVPFLSATAAADEEACWTIDGGASVIRPALVGAAQWRGRAIHPLRQVGGMAVNESWQIGVVEGWVQAQHSDRLFTARRTKWSQYYDSERAVFAALPLTGDSSVLDVGGDPGGLGIALQERFGISAYTAIVPEGGEGEVQAVNPEAKLKVGRIEALPAQAPGGFDLVSALGVADSADFLEQVLPAAFRQVSEKGALVFSLRLTNGPTVSDPQQSFQDVIAARGVRVRRSYVVRNTDEVMRALRGLHPARIVAHGYLGRPPASAHTPLDSICYVVFGLQRARGKTGGTGGPQLELHLPEAFRRG